MHRQEDATSPARPDRRRALLALAGSALAIPSWAQSGYPSKTVKVVCPYGTGSPVDFAGRYMAELLQSGLGHSVVIENLAGGGGTTGTTAVLRNPADGYTLLTQFTSALVTTNFLYKSVKYDVLKDFVPLWSLGSAGTVIVVSGKSPYKTLQEFLAAAKANPGKLTYGTSGVGSTPHINTELFMRHTGITLAHVPYRSSGNVVTDILGGHIDCLFHSITTAAPMIESGQLRGLAVLRNERVQEVPQVPTLAEGGVNGWDPIRSTFGMFAPIGTPKAVTDKLIATLDKAYQADTEGRARMLKLGLGGVTAGTDLSALLKREYGVYKKLIEDAKIPYAD